MQKMDVFLSKLRITTLTVFAIVSLCVGTVWAETELTGPATLNKAGEYYRLTEDITASGTAFTITADNITLNLNEHAITYNNNSSESSVYGVRISASNVTVKNGTIIQGSGKSSRSPVIYIDGGSGGHELHHLSLKVIGFKCYGIHNPSSGSFNSSKIHHVYLEHQMTTDGADGYGLDGILVEARTGGVEIYDNILVESHTGIQLRYSGHYGGPVRSDIYRNYIQHRRREGAKSPYGIALIRSHEVYVYDNQIISDSGRGITLDGWSGGTAKGTDNCTVSNNRIDVMYSTVAGGGWYAENNVYGIRDRYSSGENIIENNIVIVDNDVEGSMYAFYIGSDSADSLMFDILIQNNTIIARDPGKESTGSNVFVWGWAEEITCINNEYYTDGTLQKYAWGASVANLTFTNNTAITPESYTPAAPTGLNLTKFLDSYLLKWNDSIDVHGESQTYEYIVYRDGEKLDISPRGGTFYVDIDVGGTHTYSISALTLSGNEGPRCPEVSTTSAKIGWWGGSPPSSPSSLRIIN